MSVTLRSQLKCRRLWPSAGAAPFRQGCLYPSGRDTVTQILTDSGTAQGNVGKLVSTAEQSRKRLCKISSNLWMDQCTGQSKKLFRPSSLLGQGQQVKESCSSTFSQPQVSSNNMLFLSLLSFLPYIFHWCFSPSCYSACR